MPGVKWKEEWNRMKLIKTKKLSLVNTKCQL